MSRRDSSKNNLLPYFLGVGLILSSLNSLGAENLDYSKGDSSQEEPENREKKEKKKKKEIVVEVREKRRLFRPTKAMSSLETDHLTISKLPQGAQIPLPKLLANTHPGIVQGPFGQTFIRGNHANIQYQIDGVQLPDSPSNTLGQSISARNIERMEVITGGIPAEFGQRLSAVVDIVTKSGAETPSGEIELNYGSYRTPSPHLFFGGSNDSGNVHYFLSAAYNRSDRGLDTPQPHSLSHQGMGGAESIHNSSSGSNEFLKMDWLANNQDKVTVIFSHAENSFEIPTYPASFLPSSPLFQRGFIDQFGNGGDPSRPTYNYLPPETADSQREVNAYSQVVWKHTFANRSYLQLAPYFKYSLISVKNDPENDLAAQNFKDSRGEPLFAGATLSSFAQNRHVNNVGLKADYSWRLDRHLFKTGIQTQASRSDGTLSVIALRLENAQSRPRTFMGGSSHTGLFESFYIQDDYHLTDWVILNAGVRLDATQFTLGSFNSQDGMLQPRLGVNFLLSEDTKLHLFYGKLFQPAPLEHLHFQFDESAGEFQRLSTYDIKAEKADYYETGISHQFLQSQLASLNLWYKQGVNFLDDHQLLNTSIAQPYNFAKGFGYGAEFSVRGQLTSEWSEYANYSYQIAKGKGVSGGLLLGITPTDEYQYLDHVQEHTLNAGLTYTKNNFWWGVQGLYGSGLRTGVNNSISLPGHFTMDTTVGFNFPGNSWLGQFKVSADVLNLFDNGYPITIANGFNGSHYAAKRQYFVRLSKNF